jgi:tetratricopeptide (TPR) repeat protein
VAVQRLKRSVQLQPHRAKAHAALAFALEQLGRLDEARESYDAAIRADPAFAQAHNGKGVVLVKLGETSAALPCFDRAIALDASLVEPRMNAGHALLEQGLFDRAAKCFGEAAPLARSDAVLRACAAGLYQSDDLESASAILEALLRRNPADVSARAQQALVLDATGREDEALAAVDAIAVSGSADAGAENACGVILLQRHRVDEAIAHFRKALALDPSHGEALVNLALALREAGREEASRGAMQAMEAKLDAVGLARLATLYSRIGDSARSIDAAQRAIASSAHLHNAHATLATQLLRTGQLERGWREYLYRPTRGDEIVERVIEGTYPPALPGDLSGRDVLILPEQGLGDVLFFLRYAAPLAKAGAKLHTMRLDPKIGSIVQRALAIDTWPDDHPVGPDTLLVYAGDLPNLVRPLTRSDVGASLEVAVLPERVARMRERLGHPDRPRIGVAWRAGTAPSPGLGRKRMLWKDVDPAAFGKALTGLPIEIVSIQRHPVEGSTREFEAALGAKVIDCAAVNGDLEDMLALLSLLDGYAGVSSTNIHLLAALGRRGRILVPYPPEWRWQAQGRSPWFGDFGIYRQAVDGDWNVALGQLRDDLMKEMKEKKE